MKHGEQQEIQAQSGEEFLDCERYEAVGQPASWSYRCSVTGVIEKRLDSHLFGMVG